MSPLPPTQLLLTLAEPTRLRILNCLAAAPLFVSDLQAVLDLPQPTVSRHLTVLKRARLVRDTPIAQTGPQGRLLQAVLDALGQDEPMRLERHRALDRSRAHGRGRMPSLPARSAAATAEGDAR
jgi:DNA-binding transcriptional ArsR family regulator